ncbi:MAG TPA: histidine kinase dimerization/phosphoacceptor domain -containing protein [Alphaproteobacteria bacterium]|nr:histidine kinase dimerization/phosphoacceptor domain -containing protein [Alphaproteobacteria bacterium]
MSKSSPPDAVVEHQPSGTDSAEMTAKALQLRLRQQEILAELGVLALKGTPFPELIERTVSLTAEGLQAEFCKTLEYLPMQNCLLVRAGVGWDAGVIGHATVGADLDSPAGFALHTGKPVISNHLENEQRFKTPELLIEHGVRRAMNVILQGDGKPYGVLEVDSRSEGEFTEHDIAFLQGAANLLGMAIERQRIERDLKAAIDHQEVLLQEGNHRVTNSLQLVTSMLSLQATAAVSGELRDQLQEAISRISAISRAHRRLYRTKKIQTLSLGDYLIDIGHDLEEVAADCDVNVAVVDNVEVATDRAISISLIVTELITNAAKHAYGEGQACPIWVTLGLPEPNRIVISVRDQGHGLPAEFDIARRKGLGMRIISALLAQLDAAMTVERHPQGSEFILEIPLAASDSASAG